MQAAVFETKPYDREPLQRATYAGTLERWLY